MLILSKKFIHENLMRDLVSLSDVAHKAISQIKDRGYINEFRGRDTKDVIYYGISFAPNSLSVASEPVNLEAKTNP